MQSSLTYPHEASEVREHIRVVQGAGAVRGVRDAGCTAIGCVGGWRVPFNEGISRWLVLS